MRYAMRGRPSRLLQPKTSVTIELAGLHARASERLIREVLGPATQSSTVKTLVERADGNALYLEELIRAASQSQVPARALPETVLAMVEARLEALDTETRRVLRAASVFGQTFWRGG